MPSSTLIGRSIGIIFITASTMMNVAILQTAFGHDSANFTPRQPLPKLPTAVQPTFEHQLVVKFRDDLLVRSDASGGITSLAGQDLSDLTTSLVMNQPSFSQLINLDQAKLSSLQMRAAQRSGSAQPDLAGILVVHAKGEQLQAIADQLNASDLVEFVAFQMLFPVPPCDDIFPVTPMYFPDKQLYHGPNPGINMTAASALGDTSGSGIKLADCEYGFYEHEDLCDITLEPGQTIHPNTIGWGYDEHGTAVLGEIMSLDNGYGCTGLAPGAEGSFFPEYTVEEDFRRVTAITNAIASVEMGDVVLLEMQTQYIGSGYGPAELDPAVWPVCKVGADAGVIVFGAAGNGNQNLDSSVYDFYRDRGDSGAIIVGAGMPDLTHNKASFSTYGSRVNVQGWGWEVFTLGYGGYAKHGGDKKQQYTSGFNGTSSASPFVASSCLALQSVAVEKLGNRLGPLEMRQILMDTGIPQGSGGNVGPLPDMVAAIDALLGSKNLMLTPPDFPYVGRKVDFVVEHATPDAVVGLAYALSEGKTSWPNCPGISIGLTAPKLAATMKADVNGQALLTVFVPKKARGLTTYQQAGELATCRLSTVVEVTWQ